MFEGEERDAAVDGIEGAGASRCSSSSTLIAADIGKRGDGDNIDGNMGELVEGEEVVVEGEMEEGIREEMKREARRREKSVVGVPVGTGGVACPPAQLL